MENPYWHNIKKINEYVRNWTKISRSFYTNVHVVLLQFIKKGNISYKAMLSFLFSIA